MKSLMKATEFAFLLVVMAFLGFEQRALAEPISVAGYTFTLVASDSGDKPQLCSLAADTNGNVYAGNNSNYAPGIPVRLFRPGTFTNSPVPFDDFGPACQDADGLTFGAGDVYVSDYAAGVRKISAATGTGGVFVAAIGINITGSPVAYRTSDGHLFVGYGIDALGMGEFDASGGSVAHHSTSANVETMTLDPASGVIYYAPWPEGQVWAYNPTSRTDSLIATIDGTIDAGLAYDPLSGRLFVGTANGVNQGRVYTIDLTNSNKVALFATGFDGCLGILREQTSGHLYFLEAHNLYRLENLDTRPKLFICPAVELWWYSDSNQSYQVQWCSALDTNTWYDFGPPVQGSEPTTSVFDSTRTSLRRFYRINVLQ